METTICRAIFFTYLSRNCLTEPKKKIFNNKGENYGKRVFKSR